MDIEQLKYPIGEYIAPDEVTSAHINTWVSDIETLPSRLVDVVSQLNKEQLNTEYRPDGWKGNQVIHHVADSHMNAFIRFKLTLTEDTPTIRPYIQDKWVQQSDVNDAPIELSVELLKSLHARWTILLKAMDANDLKREYRHPEYNYTIALEKVIGLYAWHGNHHLAHLELLLSK